MKQFYRPYGFFMIVLVAFSLFAGAGLERRYGDTTLPEQECKASGGVWLPDYYAAEHKPIDENGEVVHYRVMTIYGCFENKAKSDIEAAFGTREHVNP